MESLPGYDNWLARPYEYPEEDEQRFELMCSYCGEIDDNLDVDDPGKLDDKTGLRFSEDDGTWHHESCGGGEVWMREMGR